MDAGKSEKLKCAGNAGKGKEGREALSIFCVVSWLDLQYGGYG